MGPGNQGRSSRKSRYTKERTLNRKRQAGGRGTGRVSTGDEARGRGWSPPGSWLHHAPPGIPKDGTLTCMVKDAQAGGEGYPKIRGTPK